MLKPKEFEGSPEAGDALGPEAGMEDILRSIRGILGDEHEASTTPVRFPDPEEPANSADNTRAAEPADRPKEPPLAFLQRRREDRQAEPAPEPTPGLSSLDERLARHRAKADAERRALRELAERASAKAKRGSEAGQSEPVDREDAKSPEAIEPIAAPQPAVLETPESKKQTVSEATVESSLPRTAANEGVSFTPQDDPKADADFDIFAEGPDLTEPPAAPPAAPTVARQPDAPMPRAPRRMALPEIEAEPVDYSGHHASAPRVEIMAASPAHDPVEDTFEDIARQMLTDRTGDMDGILSDMMRPLVRSWLDHNLSGIVERVVREEIERVSRGGR